METPRESIFSKFGSLYGLTGFLIFLGFSLLTSPSSQNKIINNTKDQVVKITTYPNGITPDELEKLSKEADSLASEGKVKVNKIIGDKSDTLSIEFKNPGDGFVKGPDGKYRLRLREIKPGEKVPVGPNGYN